MKNCSLETPEKISDVEYRFDSFNNGKALLCKKKGHLPAMGWNSWNAFGSGNTEELTKMMADKIKELGLDSLGYQYLVLDDGCYFNERVDGKLSNDKEKFPSGFKALADYMHERGLKFGMYNDIGTNLCAGAAVGTCGHEAEDAALYAEWDVDFIKVDNCYYLWDNATFSDASNAKYTYAPAIASVTIQGESGFKTEYYVNQGSIHIIGSTIKTEEIDGKVYITNIGTHDGTGPEHTPVGMLSGEAHIDVEVPCDGVYEISLDCIRGEEPGKGSWIQIAKGYGDSLEMLFDDFVSDAPIKITLSSGLNRIRLMNHRRQENTLFSYAKFLEGLNEAKPGHDIIYSLCEWGKTQPHNWAYKVGDSWRILNDIAFAVGADGNPGHCDWTSDYTNSVTAQYNKCVIMDEFSGLEKGWNDPDMMVIGMDHLNYTQYRTHMAMWCMMNSPLMLGFDLRKVKKGDDLYRIIANEELIKLNQDSLGVQAKRIFSSLVSDAADSAYITNNDRVDILAKPLSDGTVAVSFINLSGDEKKEGYSVTVEDILKKIGKKMTVSGRRLFRECADLKICDLWTGEETLINTTEIFVERLEPYDNVTVKVIPC